MKNKYDFTFIKDNRVYRKVFYKDITHIEAMSDYCIFHLTDNRKYTHHIPIGRLVDRLPDEFVQIFRSTIVNMRHITTAEGNTIYIGATPLKISENYTAIKDHLNHLVYSVEDRIANRKVRVQDGQG